MADPIYLGNVRIEMAFPSGLFGKDEIYSRFQKPCLPVEQQYSVSFLPVDEIELPEGKRVEEKPELSIVTEASGAENRLYYRFDYKVNECFLYARSRLSNGEVTVWYVPGLLNWSGVVNALWAHIHLESLLLQSKSLILHSVYFQYQNEAILFTAPSGTGKTTHSKLWEEYIGGQTVNGDRTLLQKSGGRWYACGFPVHGGAPECENRSIPLKTIVILRQAKENRIVELTIAQKVKYLYSEMTVNSWNEAAVNQAFELILDLAQAVRIVMLECTKEPDAAQYLHNYLYPGENYGTV